MNNQLISIVSFIILVLIILLLAFTNPDKEMHQYEVKQIIQVAINDNSTSGVARDSLDTKTILSGIGLIWGDDISGMITDRYVYRSNYLVFSTTHFISRGKDRVIGVGFLENVIIYNSFKKELNKTLHEVLEGRW